jgi:hypothetical protein
MDIIKNKAKYCLIDAARIGTDLQDRFTEGVRHDSLYRGRSEEALAAVAPYIAEIGTDKEFDDWLLTDGWGDNWCVFINSKFSMEELWKHFRKFLIVKNEKGEELYFRFYDPRVIRIFLPTCSENQLKEFFGPVDSFIAEDKNAEILLEFSLQNGKLHTEKIALNGETKIKDISDEIDENGMESVIFDTIV